MKTIEGDLIELVKAGNFDVIVHGCNCQNTMEAGIAKAIKEQFPSAYLADQETEKGDRGKLGSYSSAKVEHQGNSFVIVNGYTQLDWRGNGVKVSYDAVQSLFCKIKNDFQGKRIGYPLIGAGLAGGDWDIIDNIIDEQLMGEDHTLVIFKS